MARKMADIANGIIQCVDVGAEISPNDAALVAEEFLRLLDIAEFACEKLFQSNAANAVLQSHVTHYRKGGKR